MGNKQTSSLKPAVLADLRQHTAFTEAELQKWYTDFKKECPKGNLTRTDFHRVYAKFFPSGDATSFTEHVFRTFDTNQDETIDFREFICSMSVLTKGSTNDKLTWIFSLFDVDQDGFISRAEMIEILQAMDRMAGELSEKLPFDPTSAPVRTDFIFENADTNLDGRLSRQEFIIAAKNDPAMKAMLQMAI